MSSFKAGINGSFPGASKEVTKSRQGLNIQDSDSAGIATGINKQMSFNGQDVGPMNDYDRNPLTGNATERVEPYTAEKVSSKGVSFEIY